MRVRLTRRLAERIDDVDLSDRRVGDLIDMSAHDAELLIAEGWATPANPECEDADRQILRAKQELTRG
jgi:hypothetical protein